LWAERFPSNLPVRPMIFLHLITRVLWVVPLVLQAAIAFVMARRKLFVLFPVFFAYTVVVLSQDIVLLFLRYPGNAYARVYWCGEALAVLLSLGVIFESLKYLFPPFPFRRLLLKCVWVVGAIAAVIAIAMLLIANNGAGTARIFEFVILLERSARFLQTCLLIVVIALVSRLGLTWRHYSVGIVAGFGIYSALDLVILEFHSHLHLISDSTLFLLNSAAYNVAAIVWAFYCLRSWRRTPLERLPKADLAEWNDAVGDYVDQWHRRYSSWR
jgi:hypothetical protein